MTILAFILVLVPTTPPATHGGTVMRPAPTNSVIQSAPSHTVIQSAAPDAVIQLVSPDTVTLAQCYEAAAVNFPLVDRREIALRIAELESANASAAWRPSVSLEGQAVYHSHVPELPFDVPAAGGFSIPHDQYRMALSVNQLIYDGGLSHVRRRLADTSARLADKEVMLAFHDVKQLISDAYFGALMQDAAISSFRLLREEIVARRTQLRAQANEGLVDGGVLDALEVELLGIEQRIADAQEHRRGAVAALAVMTGLDLDARSPLQLPDIDVRPIPEAALQRARPQYGVFETQRRQLDLQQELTSRRNRPRVSGFATGAYGRPAGMDIFETTLTPFYSVGVRASWSVWDWRTSDREGQMLQLRADAIDARESAFTQQVRASAEQSWREVVRLREAIARDEAIVAIRRRTASRAADRLAAGTVSATEYTIEQNALQRSELAAQQRRIELEYAKARYKLILGGDGWE